MMSRDVYLLSRSDEFHLDRGEEASINLKLHKAPPLPCTRLCGRVVSNKTCIAGATVKVLTPDLKPICHTVTGFDGKFSFDHVLPPGKYEIIAAAENYLVSRSRLIFLKPFVTTYLSIRLCPDKAALCAALYGTVRNEVNKPLQGAVVCISGHGTCRITLTNDDGEYLFAGMAPGKYAITALLRGYTLPKNVTVELMPRDISCLDLYLYKNCIPKL